METATAAPDFANIARKFTKLLRGRRSDNRAAAAAKSTAASSLSDYYVDSLDNSINSLDKLKLYYTQDSDKTNTKQQQQQQHKPTPPTTTKGRPVLTREAAESLVANLFAGVSAVKAAYAQMQMAQSPYDPDSIQSADAAVVAELKRLSGLKRAYVKDPEGISALESISPGSSALAAQAEEQRHLLKTYQITTRKLEAEVVGKENQMRVLQDELGVTEKETRALDARLHPGKSLAALDELHLSGLNPTHFLTALRHTVKSIRSFTRDMIVSMQSAGWDLNAAAAAVHPSVPIKRPVDNKFAFESYICMKILAGFQRRDFSLSFLEEREFFDRRGFFEEFLELKSLPMTAILDETNTKWLGFRKFLRARYLSLVHPKMEMAFFGRLEQRGIVCAGPGFPDSKWFLEFAEMARRVWLLHCLFFAFEDYDDEGEEVCSIFQARSGSRFSEVYMESAAEEEANAEVAERVVGFTVVPGFRVGRAVIQCRVYLLASFGVS